jgi:MOSC domain-containing protein YiiM
VSQLRQPCKTLLARYDREDMIKPWSTRDTRGFISLEEGG